MKDIKGMLGTLKRRMNSHREEYAIRHSKGQKIDIALEDILFNNVRLGELLRCDIVVRYLAIENYYNKNSFGFDLYKKMQDKRIGEEYGDKAVKQFKILIDSYEKNGYDYESAIVLDCNLGIIDGSHRVALGLYHGIRNISALVINFNHPVDYSIDWFLSVGFTKDETDIILKKAEELLDDNNSPFACVIWSPAVKFSDSLIYDLGYYGKVESIKKYSYKKEEYANITRAIYAIDDIERWKIEKKLENMPENELVVVGLKIKSPFFRVKASTGKPISRVVERAKKAIRKRYQDHIDNYFFDTILHIADNHQQSDYMWHIFDPQIDFREVLKILEEYTYALIKVDVPFIPEDFPERIPSGKDVDILCTKGEIQAIKEKLIRYSSKYSDYEIVEKVSSDRLLLRFNLSGKIVFQIDCYCSYEGIPDEFLEYALENRVIHEKGYYILEPAVEAMIRRVAFEENRNKIYHLEYYNNNRTEEVEGIFEKTVAGKGDCIAETFGDGD